jgi:hypothetical protein
MSARSLSRAVEETKGRSKAKKKEKTKTNLLRLAREIRSRLDGPLDAGLEVRPAADDGAVDGQRVARRVRDGDGDLAVLALRGDGCRGADLRSEGGREG